MPTGRVLVGAGTGYTAGETGGNKTVTLTVDQMPSHSHDNTLTAAGGHSHSRGTMEITAGIRSRGFVNDGNHCIQVPEGAFYSESTPVSDVMAAGSNGGTFNQFRFAASRSWVGATNTVPNHNHTITNASAGGGSAVSIEQPWLAVYMWKRTK